MFYLLLKHVDIGQWVDNTAAKCYFGDAVGNLHDLVAWNGRLSSASAFQQPLSLSDIALRGTLTKIIVGS